MAMQLGGSSGIKSDINVTPLVDVMLVLLIIMMIVAPLLQQGVPVELPRADNSSEKPETQDQTVVTIDRSKAVYLNAVPVPAGQLQSRITTVLEDKSDKIVIIKADQEVPYSAVMDTMDELRAAGIEDMGLITERRTQGQQGGERSEEHTSELQSPCNIVCRLLLEKKQSQRWHCKNKRRIYTVCHECITCQSNTSMFN